MDRADDRRAGLRRGENAHPGDHGGAATAVHVEYGLGFATRSGAVRLPAGQTRTVVLTLRRLRAGHRYAFRVVARSAFGATARAGTLQSADTTPPSVRVRRAVLRPGASVLLLMRLADNSGAAGTRVTVYHGARRVALAVAAPHALSGSGWYGTRWQVPPTLGHGAWRWCAVAVDRTGNRSPRRRREQRRA